MHLLAGPTGRNLDTKHLASRTNDIHSSLRSLNMFHSAHLTNVGLNCREADSDGHLHHPVVVYVYDGVPVLLLRHLLERDRDRDRVLVPVLLLHPVTVGERRVSTPGLHRYLD